MTRLFLWFHNVATQTYNIEEDDSLYCSEVIMNNDMGIIFAVEGHPFLMYIWRVSVNSCSPLKENPYEPRHLPELTCDFQIGSATLPGAPKVLSGAPTCSQPYHNHSPGTPVPVIRDAGYCQGWPECPPRV